MKNRFIEMANVLKMDTELPMNIWIDSEGAYIKSGHAKRIKFQLNKAISIQKGNFATVALYNSEIVDKEKVLKKRNCELTARDMKEVENFVYNNNFGLSCACDMILSEKQILNNMIVGGDLASESEIAKVKSDLQDVILKLYEKGYYDSDPRMKELAEKAMME